MGGRDRRLRTVFDRDGYQIEENMTEREFTLEEAREIVPWLVATFRTLEPPRSRAKQIDAAIKELSSRIKGNGGGSSQRQLERLQRATSRRRCSNRTSSVCTQTHFVGNVNFYVKM